MYGHLPSLYNQSTNLSSKPTQQNLINHIFQELVMKVSEEMINYFQDLFVEVDMVELGEGTSDKDVQFIGPDVSLNNWEATPLPV